METTHFTKVILLIYVMVMAVKICIWSLYLVEHVTKYLINQVTLKEK